jgi:hypothetical protein
MNWGKSLMKRLIPSEPTNASPEESANAPEDQLDALLNKVEEKRANRELEPQEREPDAIDVFRGLMRQVYIPVFETLSEKYASKGISMELDADEFLGGGPSLRIKFSYGELTMDLDGTVMRGGVAFYIVRGIGSNKGAVVSGPMLRIRNLTAEDFREFIVDHLSQLIKDALRQA